MKTENEIVDILYKKYQNQGFITEQAIFDLCDDNSLSFLATDRVCNKLIDLGVLITDDSQNIEIDKTEEAVYKDYSQIDYNEVYDFYFQNYPQMQPIINYIKSLPPPQKGENNNLVIQMRSGNKYARKQVIEKNLRTALRIAMNYNDKTTIPVDELFSVACEGLMAAVDSFDPYSNSYFTSYSSYWIMQKIDRYIMDNQYLVRIPVYSYERLNKIKEIINSSNGLFNYNLVKLIMCKLGIGYYEALEWIRIILVIDPIDVDDVNDECFLEDDSLNTYIENYFTNKWLCTQLEKLSSKEKDVLVLRYGLNGNNRHTLEEVGNLYHVTRERIRQIEAKSLRKVKHYIKHSPLYSEYIKYYKKDDDY